MEGGGGRGREKGRREERQNLKRKMLLGALNLEEIGRKRGGGFVPKHPSSFLPSSRPLYHALFSSSLRMLETPLEVSIAFSC